LEPEKTLLQQIREKEQEYAQKIELVKAETEAATAAAKSEAESLLCTADSAGSAEAERLYWQEKGRVGAEIETLKSHAAAERESAVKKSEANLPRAVQVITGYVTME
jgi:hypothetical protein